MRSLNATIFTEIALSLVAINNASTWVKALWIEQELAARGLWRDDVFELIRPFLVTGRSRQSEEKPKPVAQPVPLLKPAGPRERIVVSRPVQTAAEAEWAPSFDDDPQEDVPAKFAARGETAKTAETPGELTDTVSVDRHKPDQPSGDSVETPIEVAAPAPIDDYDAESERWQPEPTSALQYDELTADQAELASMMHLLAVSTRLNDTPGEIEPGETGEVESPGEDVSYVIGEPIVPFLADQTSAGPGTVPSAASFDPERLPEPAKAEKSEALSLDKSVKEEIAIEWVSEPVLEIETASVPEPREKSPEPDVVPELKVNLSESLAVPELKMESPESDTVPELKEKSPEPFIVAEYKVNLPESDTVPEPKLNLPEPDVVAESKVNLPESDVLPELKLNLPESDVVPEPKLNLPESELESGLAPESSGPKPENDIEAWASAWQEAITVTEPKPSPIGASVPADTPAQIEPAPTGPVAEVPIDAVTTAIESPFDQSTPEIVASAPTVAESLEPETDGHWRARSSEPQKKVSAVTSADAVLQGTEEQAARNVKRKASETAVDPKLTKRAAGAEPRGTGRPAEPASPEPAEAETVTWAQSSGNNSQPAGPEQAVSVAPNRPGDKAAPVAKPTSVSRKRSEEKPHSAVSADVVSQGPKSASGAKTDDKKLRLVRIENVASSAPESLAENSTQSVSPSAVSEATRQHTEPDTKVRPRPEKKSRSTGSENVASPRAASAKKPSPGKTVEPAGTPAVAAKSADPATKITAAPRQRSASKSQLVKVSKAALIAPKRLLKTVIQQAEPSAESAQPAEDQSRSPEPAKVASPKAKSATKPNPMKKSEIADVQAIDSKSVEIARVSTRETEQGSDHLSKHANSKKAVQTAPKPLPEKIAQPDTATVESAPVSEKTSRIVGQVDTASPELNSKVRSRLEKKLRPSEPRSDKPAQTIVVAPEQTSDTGSLLASAKKTAPTAQKRPIRRATRSSEPDTGKRPMQPAPATAKDARKPSATAAATTRRLQPVRRASDAAIRSEQNAPVSLRKSSAAVESQNRGTAVLKPGNLASSKAAKAATQVQASGAAPKTRSTAKRRAAEPAPSTVVHTAAKTNSAARPPAAVRTAKVPTKSASLASAKKKAALITKRTPKRVLKQSPTLVSKKTSRAASGHKQDSEQVLKDVADAAAIADLYGLHIDTASAADRARLLFFASALKSSGGDWAGSEAQLKTALKAAERSNLPELWKQVIEQSLKIHRKLDRPAA